MANETITGNWLSLKDAAALLNVHPGTLRRWADNGSIPYMLTPGGHRRFSQNDIDRFLQEQRRAQQPMPMVQAWAEQAMTRTRQGIETQRHKPWMETMDADHRDQHRQLGRRLMGLTLQYISSEDENGGLLAEAQAIGHEYGRINQAIGMALTDALAASIFFRDELIEVALQLPDTAGVRQQDNLRLMRRINHVLNAVHLAIAEIYAAIKDENVDAGQNLLLE